MQLQSPLPIHTFHGMRAILTSPALLACQVMEQQKEWADLYTKLQTGLAAGSGPVTSADFFWALSAVRSRTFSGPYVASTLSDWIRLAGFVAALIVGNTLLGSIDLTRSLGAAAAVFVFNILYEVILSNKLKQYAMCPVIDLLNHSSSETVGCTQYRLDVNLQTIIKIPHG